MSRQECAIDGCDKTPYARSWCRKHYVRWQRHGDPTAMLRGENPEQCTVDGCDRKPHARELCRMHYKRLQNTGSTEPHGKPRYSNREEAFVSRIRQEGDCLEWAGQLGGNGYGRMWDGGHIPAHRYAWERANGPIPKGMHIDHMCWNRLCVNVEHLRLVTHAQNMQNQAGARVDSASGVRGVYWDKKSSAWVASASVNGKRYTTGRFNAIGEAERAAIALRKEVMPWSIK